MALLATDAAIDERELHVLERGRAREEVEALEDEAEDLVAHLGELVLAHLRDLPAREQVACPPSDDRGSRGCSSASTCPSRTSP